MPKIKIQCSCGKSFMAWPNHKRKFCSHRCYAKSIKGRKMEWLEARYKTNWQKEIAHKISVALKGKKKSASHKKHLSLAKKDLPAWNKGLPGPQGKNSSNWRGGSRISGSGYRMIWVGKRKYRPEHVLVLEKYLGRRLKANEVVHHIDGNRINNSIKNLQLFNSHRDHARKHYHSGEWKHLKYYTPKLLL